MEVHGAHHWQSALAGGGAVVAVLHARHDVTHLVLDGAPRRLVLATAPKAATAGVGLHMQAAGFRHLGLEPRWVEEGAGAGGGLRAVARQVLEGAVLVVAVDGPSGPPGVARPGAALVASMAGRPLLPLTWGLAPRYVATWRWDHHVVPWPGRRWRAVARFGAPVPTGDGPRDAVRAARDLTERLASLTRWCDEMATRARDPWGGPPGPGPLPPQEEAPPTHPPDPPSIRR